MMVVVFLFRNHIICLLASMSVPNPPHIGNTFCSVVNTIVFLFSINAGTSQEGIKPICLLATLAFPIGFLWERYGFLIHSPPGIPYLLPFMRVEGLSQAQ